MMDTKIFNDIAENRIAHCRRTLLEKGEEYSRNGDRLHNFRSAADIDGETPEQALWGMAKKHVVSVRDMVKDVEHGIVPSEKMLNEKITDWINYGLLLEGLLVERIRGNLIKTPIPKECFVRDEESDRMLRMMGIVEKHGR